MRRMRISNAVSIPVLTCVVLVMSPAVHAQTPEDPPAPAGTGAAPLNEAVQILERRQAETRSRTEQEARRIAEREVLGTELEARQRALMRELEAVRAQIDARRAENNEERAEALEARVDDLRIAQAETQAQARDNIQELQRTQALRQSLEQQLRAQRSELEQARTQLDAAAREVARLSSEAVQPIVQQYTDLQPARMTLGRARLGLVIESADEGVRVAGVTPNGPAARAGVREGDVIVAIDGDNLSAVQPVQADVVPSLLSELEPGDSLDLRILRDGSARSVTVVTDANPARSVIMLSPDSEHVILNSPAVTAIRPVPGQNITSVWSGINLWNNRWGDMQLVPLTAELGAYFGTEAGILVVRGPQSNDLDLRDGDVILDIGGRVPSSPEHAMRILGSFEPGETLRIRIMRQRQVEELELQLPATGQTGARFRLNEVLNASQYFRAYDGAVDDVRYRLNDFLNAPGAVP